MSTKLIKVAVDVEPDAAIRAGRTRTPDRGRSPAERLVSRRALRPPVWRTAGALLFMGRTPDDRRPHMGGAVLGR